tara:strand:+ start:108 stop:791 length:684 start_codon:yes stop_codon:yes gene_type:complete
MIRSKYNHIEHIDLPNSRDSHWKLELTDKIKGLNTLSINLDCKDWLLTYKELLEIIRILNKNSLKLNKIKSTIPETIVSSSALGIEGDLIIKKGGNSDLNTQKSSKEKEKHPKLLFHNGTLRSGENLSNEGDILLLGDVNPGAKISAGGDILIWGRLRGIAHAGKNGNQDSTITALELRPLQLRIASVIARGPAEKPEPGLAEEARIIKGEIVIDPARINVYKERTK